MSTGNGAWVQACVTARGHVLIGLHAHYCPEYEDLPVDETTPEWPCSCFEPRPENDPSVLAQHLHDDGDELV